MSHEDKSLEVACCLDRKQSRVGHVIYIRGDDCIRNSVIDQLQSTMYMLVQPGSIKHEFINTPP